MSARFVIVALLGLGLVAGCSDEPEQTVQKPERKTPEFAQAESAAAVETVEYRYDPSRKGDPFRSFIRTDDADETLSTPLERFDLSQLRVTAIIWGAESNRALVQDPSGSGHIVSHGTQIGKNQGRVVDIADNLIRVKETYVDFRDRATTKEVEMRLYERQ